MSYIDSILVDDALIKVLTFLTPSDLFATTLVSQRWKHLTESDENIWLHHAMLIWQSLEYNVPSDFNLSCRMKKVPLNQLRIGLRHVDITRCLEKDDYQRMAIIHLVFAYIDTNDMSYIFSCMRSSSNVWLHKCIINDHHIYYPDWLMNISHGKISYLYAKKQANKTRLLLSELVAIEWEFTFNDDIYLGMNENGSPASWESTFSRDYTMRSGIHNEPLNWKFVYDAHYLRYIQVESYPSLTISRLENGRWLLKNTHVTFTQKHSILPDELPLF